MPRWLLEKAAMHYCRYEKPVYSVVINLTGGKEEERCIMDCVDMTVIDFSYRPINRQN